MRSIGRLLVVLLALAPAIGALADPKGSRWDDLSPEERDRVWKNYRQYQGLPSEKKRSIDQRYQRYKELPPQERSRVRKNYDRYQKMTPSDRRRFDDQYRRWKQRSQDD